MNLKELNLGTAKPQHGLRVRTAVKAGDRGPNHGVRVRTGVKSGGNDLHGGSSILYTNHNFESNNIGEQYQEWGLRTKPKLHWVADFNAHLGGQQAGGGRCGGPFV